MTVASSNLPNIGVGVVKKNMNLITTPVHIKKRLRLKRIYKTTLVRTPTKSMRIRLPTMTSQPWFKLKQLM